MVKRGLLTVWLRQQVPVSVANIDANVHRQADARGFSAYRGIEHDTDRQTLDNFDPVTAGVLCRQQRESAAGANAQALDGAVILNIIAVQIRAERDFCPRRIPFIWLSLKLASTQTSFSGTIAISVVPESTRMPSCTARFAT